MKKLYFSYSVLAFSLLFLLVGNLTLMGQITNEFDNGGPTDPVNDAATDTEVEAFSIPGGVAGEFQVAGDNDFFSITLTTTAPFELVILNPQNGNTAAPGFSVTIVEYNDGLRTSPTGITFTPAHGDEVTLAGLTLFYSIDIEQTDASISGYTVALAAGNGNVGDAVFPVEWLSFETASTNAGVNLSWSTASEENNKGFEVERSVDAETWEFLGFVEGAGTTTEIQAYSFVDTRPEMGFNYYRLKQIDYNGDFDYSDISEIALSLDAFSGTPSVFPNPIQSQLTIGPYVGQASILDLSGRVIFQKRLNGEWQEENLEWLASGTYLLYLQPVSGSSHYIYLSKN